MEKGPRVERGKYLDLIFLAF